MLKSGIYLGQVRHRRMVPVEHAFSYRVFMMYLDLAELPRLFDGRWLWSDRRPALAQFRREDHFGDPGEPLDDAVRSLVAQETGMRVMFSIPSVFTIVLIAVMIGSRPS